MKAVICFATGFEEVEALSVVDVLRRGQVDIQMVGIENHKVTGAHQITIEMDTILEAIDPQQVDMIILPGGGMGTQNLKACKRLTEILKEAKENKKWLAAICAAPSVLGQIGLLKGEKAVCYPGFEQELLQAEVGQEKVVVSHQIVTATGAGTALEFALKLLEIIKGKEVAETVRRNMLIP